MKISIIIPTYNRERNLAFTLTALKNQTFKDFEVIVADDGSVDKTSEVVKRFPDVKYIYLGENKGYRQSRARNEGVKIASKDSDAYIFLDADVLLPPNALELYIEDYKKEPNRVVCGIYHWGIPMEITEEDILERWEDIINERLPEMGGDPHGMQGQDIRMVLFDEKTVDDLCFEDGHYLAAFGGNLLVPKKIFEAIGLYNKAYNPEKNDEHCGYDQYFTAPIEDGDFGLTLRDVGYPICFDNRIVAYHVWHPRNIGEIQKVSTEQIPYLDKKHQSDIVKMTQQTYRGWLKDDKEREIK